MKITRLDISERQKAVAVLSTAFYDYPVMSYIAGRNEADYDNRLQSLIGFYVDVRFQRDWPVLAVTDNDEVVAIALVNEPVNYAWIDGESTELEVLKNTLGDKSYARMVSFEESSSGGEPDYPHHFLGMIGVLPEAQGKGYAYHLIQHVIDLSRNDHQSLAVALTTESEKNITYYENLGFEMNAEQQVGDFISRAFVFPTRKQN